VLQKKGNPLSGGQPGQGQRAPLGVNDGKGVMFISHTGQVHPSGFMPVRCGSFPKESVVDIYQNDPTFRALRDPDRFHGKCGVCEFRKVCGGSRARAYAVHRDIIASEPDCVYIPKNWDPVKQQRINADSPLAAMPS
jgi:radical SAM protein with 4Fe4S-binding SPASM domain